MKQRGTATSQGVQRDILKVFNQSSNQKDVDRPQTNRKQQNNDYLDVSMNDSCLFNKNVHRNLQQKSQASTIKVASIRGQSELFDASPITGHVKTIMNGGGKVQIAQSYNPSLNVSMNGGWGVGSSGP